MYKYDIVWNRLLNKENGRGKLNLLFKNIENKIIIIYKVVIWVWFSFIFVVYK